MNDRLDDSLENKVAAAVANDDGSTQLSSDGSGKPPSFDTKSVASGTTFAMDEKESLRPDDSASIRAAIEEEDLISAPGSVVAGSRVGSDLGAKPFRDQLHDAPYTGAVPMRGITGHTFQLSGNVTMPGLPRLNQSSPGNAATVAHTTGADEQSSSPGVNPPDEKLLDALQSQRDRVWVLKLEQDIIDFVGQSK